MKLENMLNNSMIKCSHNIIPPYTSQKRRLNKSPVVFFSRLINKSPVTCKIIH